MSSVFHAIGKFFSEVWDAIRPIVIVVAAVVAVYFTAGLALSAFASTAAFAAAMPGFAAGGSVGFGIGAGAVAGTGVFSEAAAAIGLGGGLAGGALASGTTAGELAAAGYSAGEIGAGASSALAAGGTVTAGAGEAGTAATAGEIVPTAGAAGGTTGTAVVGSTGAVGAGSGVGTAAAAVGKTSIVDKLLLASVATNAISGLTAPSPADIQSAKNGFYGSFYGVDSKGVGAASPVDYVGPQTELRNNSPDGTAAPQLQIPGVNIPGQQTQTTAAAGAQGANAASTYTSAQQQKLIPDIPYTGQPLPGSTPDFAVQGSTPLNQPRLINSMGSNS